MFCPSCLVGCLSVPFCSVLFVLVTGIVTTLTYLLRDLELARWSACPTSVWR